MKKSFQISIQRIKIMYKRCTYILEKLLGILQLISFTSWWSSIQENKKSDPSTTPLKASRNFLKWTELYRWVKVKT